MTEQKLGICGIPLPATVVPSPFGGDLGPWTDLSGVRHTAELLTYNNKFTGATTCGYLLRILGGDHKPVAYVRIEIGAHKTSVLFDTESRFVADPLAARRALELAIVEGAKRATFYGGLDGEVTFGLDDRDNPLGLTFNNEPRSTEKPVQPVFWIAGFDDYEYDLAQVVQCAVLRILKTKYSSGMPWSDVVRTSGLSERDLDGARASLLREKLVEALRGDEHVIYRISERGVDWLSGHEDALNSHRDLMSVGADGKSEYILPPGDEYRAMSLVLRVMQLARARLFVADAWLDDTVFPFLEAVNPDVEIRLLTAKRKPMFSALLEALQKTRPNIGARECGECHDRFLVIDDSTVWHLGASINGLGSKLARLSRVTDEEDRKRYLGIFDDLWRKGTAVLA